MRTEYPRIETQPVATALRISIVSRTVSFVLLRGRARSLGAVVLVVELGHNLESPHDPGPKGGVHVPAVPAHPRGAHQVQVLEVPVRLNDLDHLARGHVVGCNLALAVPNREKLTRGVDAKASQPVQQVFGARLVWGGYVARG